QAGLWSGASPLAETNPVTVLITLASGEVLSKSIELKSTIRNAGIENDIYPSAPQLTAVSAEFVRTGEYVGVYVDFAEVGVVDATDVELRLNRADGTTYSTHAKEPVLNAVNANNAAYS